ncbi:MAG: hypothetical protein ACRDWH_10180 [Acidimicrobiia bacterium]
MRRTAATEQELTAWFTGRISEPWGSGPVEVESDRDEIVVTIPLTDPELANDATDAEHATARQARIEGFREDTRQPRMRIAAEAERQFGKKVSWAARVGEQRGVFTNLAAPAMTRLRMRDRKVLDTLIDAGVARSRAEALAWCVRLVRQHEEAWLSDLREALSKVEEVREQGPS